MSCVASHLEVDSKSHWLLSHLPRSLLSTGPKERFSKRCTRFRLSWGARAMGHGDQRIGIFETAFYLLTQVWSGLEVFTESTCCCPGGFCFPHFPHPTQGPPRTLTLPPLRTVSACPVTLTWNHIYAGVMLQSRWGSVWFGVQASSPSSYVSMTLTSEPCAPLQGRQGRHYHSLL